MQIDLENVLGKKITCPKCNKEGIVARESFRVGGKVYWYYVVRHYDVVLEKDGKKKRNTRRCMLGPAKIPAKGVAVTESQPAKKPAKEEDLQREIEALKAENEELRRENAELRGQLAGLQNLQNWLIAAKASALTIDRDTWKAFRVYYVEHKPSKLTAEQRQLAVAVKEALASGIESQGLATVIFGPLPL